MSKKNKAEAVLEMLSKGMSTKEIINKIAVSASYVHMIKKQLAEGVGEAVETVRQTAAEHNKKVKEMIEDWRAEAENDWRAEADITPEFAFSLSQGRQKRREAEQNEAIARIKANRHEVPEHQQHLITEHEWNGFHDRVWCKHGIDQLGEMCEVCYPEAFGKAQSIDIILNERGSNYGAFLDNARITQRLKAVAHQFAGENNKTFDADQAEALDMIFTKIGRILNGDANHIDSWIDIAGYATLVADRLQGKAR